MKKLGARGLGFVHLIVAALAVLWAYTSYKYNWLNIGGGIGDIDFWIVTGNIASYSFLGAWLSLLVITAFNSKALFPTFKAKVVSWLLAIGLPVVTVFLADWFFHRGFPPPPPM
jgi:multisubunit Na+/H+ antiporter MnhB subunit